MKLYKIFFATVISTMCFASNVVKAEEISNHAVCPFMSSYSYYVSSSKTLSTKIDVTEQVVNNTSSSKTTSVTRSRTRFTQLTAGISSDTDLIGSELNLNAELSSGKQDTVSTTLTANNHKPKQTLTFKFGSKTVKTTGKVYTYNSSCNLSSRSAGAYYTYMGYSAYN